MKRIILLLLSVTALLAGCAASGPAFSPAHVSDPEAATVYIYRKPALALTARAAYFYVNDVNVFDLNSGGYSWVALPAGTFTLRQEWSFDMLAKPLVLTFETNPKQSRYFSFETNVCGAGYKEICLGWRLREERAEVGRTEIQAMKYQENFGASKLAQKLGATVSK